MKKLIHAVRKALIIAVVLIITILSAGIYFETDQQYIPLPSEMIEYHAAWKESFWKAHDMYVAFVLAHNPLKNHITIYEGAALYKTGNDQQPISHAWQDVKAKTTGNSGTRVETDVLVQIDNITHRNLWVEIADTSFGILPWVVLVVVGVFVPYAIGIAIDVNREFKLREKRHRNLYSN